MLQTSGRATSYWCNICGQPERCNGKERQSLEWPIVSFSVKIDGEIEEFCGNEEEGCSSYEFIAHLPYFWLQIVQMDPRVRSVHYDLCNQKTLLRIHEFYTVEAGVDAGLLNPPEPPCKLESQSLVLQPRKTFLSQLMHKRIQELTRESSIS